MRALVIATFLASSWAVSPAAAQAPPSDGSRQQGEGNPVSPVEVTASPADKPVCKTVKVTGSRVRTTKVCKTPQQIRNARGSASTRDALKDVEREMENIKNPAPLGGG